MTTLFNSLPLTQRRLLVLLQNALWDKSSRVHFDGMSYDEWEKIMDLAAIQGVLGIAFDGLKGVPEPDLPPRDIMIKWGLGVKKIENRYHSQLETLKSLAELYRKEGIKTLLLKGIGISKLYPVPEHRESGDLDIFLFGDFEKGNALIEKQGIKIDYHSSDVHSKFIYKQIPVENHSTFLQIEGRKENIKTEDILRRKLYIEEQPFDAKLGVYLPAISFNLLFLILHSVKHFLMSGIVLRHLCDWAVLIHSIKKKELFSDFYEISKELELNRYVDVYDSITLELLGLPDEVYLPKEKNIDFINKVISDVMNQNRVELLPPRTKLIHTIKGKLKGAMFLFKSRWKYKIINKRAFLEELRFHVKYCFRSVKTD